MVNIYTLADPRTDEIRYVGKTIESLNARLWGHMNLLRVKGHNRNWIISLKNQGLTPKIELVDVVSDKNWIEEEKFYISYFRFLGFRLTNLTDGGEGFSGRKIPFTQKARQIETRKNNGKPHVMLQHTKDKLKVARAERVSRLGYFHSPEQRQRISERFKGKKYDLIRRMKHANALDALRKRNIEGRKPVVQFDLQGNKVAVHESITAAAKSVNRSITAISRVVLGKIKTSAGYIWKYENN